MSPAHALARPGGFRHVVVVSGHVTDAPDRTSERFPERAVPAVEHAISKLFEMWDLGPLDLLVCGGARGADLLAARLASTRGTTVWLMLAAEPEAFERTSVSGAETHWVDAFWRGVQRSPAWVLGRDSRFADREDVFAAANEWMLETALTQATGSRVRVVAVWDRAPAAGSGGTGHMIEVAGEAGAEIVVIDPITGETASSPGPSAVGR